MEMWNREQQLRLKQCDFICIAFVVLHHVGDARIAFPFDE